MKVLRANYLINLYDICQLLYKASYGHLEAILLDLVYLLHDLGLRLNCLVKYVVHGHPEPHYKLHFAALLLIAGTVLIVHHHRLILQLALVSRHSGRQVLLSQPLALNSLETRSRWVLFDHYRCCSSVIFRRLSLNRRS